MPAVLPCPAFQSPCVAQSSHEGRVTPLVEQPPPSLAVLVALLEQQPGCGQWRALLDMHTNTHTHTHSVEKERKKGKKKPQDDCRKGILAHCCL